MWPTLFVKIWRAFLSICDTNQGRIADPPWLKRRMEREKREQRVMRFNAIMHRSAPVVAVCGLVAAIATMVWLGEQGVLPTHKLYPYGSEYDPPWLAGAIVVAAGIIFARACLSIFYVMRVLRYAVLLAVILVGFIVAASQYERPDPLDVAVAQAIRAQLR